MAYRRKQVVSRSSTFKEDININGRHELLDDNEPNSAPPIINTNSLAAQAIKASASRRHPSHSFALLNSSSNNSSLQHDNHHRSKSFDSYGDASKSGFWGVLAQKAKEILEDDHDHDTQKLRSYSFNIPPGARTQDGRAIGESKLKGCEDSNQLIWNPWQQQSMNSHSSIHETQLKASRDVAMATAAKAKLLLRELKTVKADLAFAKARCAQLEEENKLLRDKEGREKGQNRADDDLIRLQLETLLAEKARLASENEVYSRENRFLREIVEYHQLTMQDVMHFDESMEEDTDLDLYGPIDTTQNGNIIPLMLSPRSQLSTQQMQSKSIFSVSQRQQHDQNA
ncbi:hypothetical protein MtrunA17_Chr8g0334431 [Medicago truncatula]|uniref:Uncharacterized protein n=1 Tax=Medicago truncatula TaxID=3880 RepID=Q1STQ5_MEDTR|nr:hypothetical protein MtrDRAFT_AC136139g6v2 [Medicago truncatula]AET01109.1 hypothetical protein MTR_8g005120 [Medicago truncatula]RHN38550.1 hypothetical protein MtrunA17_Chr8g0334431 [Medicago truncatula]